MGEVIKFKGKSMNVKDSKESIIDTEDFFATYNSYSNSELFPTYKVLFENAESWGGKVTEIQKLEKKDSYMSLLGSGTCGVFEYSGADDKIVNYVTAELDSDIEELGNGKYWLYLVFKEELEGWVIEALKESRLYFTAT